MSSENAPEAQDPLAELHTALQDWRQGDLIAETAIPAVVIFRRTQPLTETTAALAEEAQDEKEETLVGEQEFEALVVTSQTCDVIEHPKHSPYVTLSPLVRINDEGQAGEARRGYMPRYPPLPGAGDDAFADLALSTTIEKAVLLGVARTPGLRDDDEIRLFQRITQRHYGRFAFPEAMHPALHLLRERLRDKKDKDSFEGHALRIVDEIRLLPTPDWRADSIDVDLFFLVKSRDAMNALENDPEKWEAQRSAWETRCVPNDSIKTIRLILVPFAELDAETYAASDPWDLGGMSPQ
jgi:hypothetical protein